jgi:hypothetical protein
MVAVGMSPTQRSLKHLRDAGYTVAIVEHYNSFTRKRYDLWGFADLLAIRTGEVLAVQTTSGSNVSARVRKIAESPLVGAVRDAGVRIHVHGWRKGSNGRYSLREVDLS